MEDEDDDAEMPLAPGGLWDGPFGLGRRMAKIHVDEARHVAHDISARLSHWQEPSDFRY
jgi:hypothetical protein